MEHKLKFGLIGTAALLAMSVQAGDLELSDNPLFSTSGVAPNIIFTLDDSTSMTLDAVPGDVHIDTTTDTSRTLHIIPFVYPHSRHTYSLWSNNNYPITNAFNGSITSKRARSSAINSIYYNPNVTYTPWSKADGSSMGDVRPTCARDNPIAPVARAGETEPTHPAYTTCINLTTKQTVTTSWYSSNSKSALGTTSTYESTYDPAIYYTYRGPVDEKGKATNLNGSAAWNPSNYTKHTIYGGKEMQNFANWYTYYRSRILTARAGIGHALGKQGTNLRVGFTTLDQAARRGHIIRGIRPFSGSHKTELFDYIYNGDISAGTRTRVALYNIGKYFQDGKGAHYEYPKNKDPVFSHRDITIGSSNAKVRTDDPWTKTPGVGTRGSSNPALSCRQTYNILITDGTWTNDGFNRLNNVDGSNGDTISGPNNDDYQYTPHSPYQDGASKTLADVAMEFWNTDLQPNLTNDVSTNNDDPAFWQHMANFMVGFGIEGTLQDQNVDNYPDGTSVNWPTPNTSDNADPRKVDDLLHAAVNSRGDFFSVTQPKEFADAISSILDSIVSSRRAAASSISINTNSGSVLGSKLYQAKYDSSDWSGQLLAYEVNANGSVKTDPSWDAAIPKANDRVIFTYNTDSNKGVPFTWNNLSAAQHTQLLGSEDVLNYIRGDKSNEGTGKGYRKRKTLLGDLVHSNPTYVGAPAQRYPDNWGAGAKENEHPYSTFRINNHSRKAMVYVGANDGMLHAFNADTGKEKFAYVPSEVMANLPKLTKTDYSHQYYVDGSPIIADAFFKSKSDSDSNWHTVLVGGLRNGGQGIYALDVTDPDHFTKDKVLWEYTDKDDNGLGYTFGTPSVVRLNNGNWGVVVSGGYNNTVKDNHFYRYGYAFLYIINLETGKLIRKFSTNVGNHTKGSDGSKDPLGDPSGKHRPNGLSTPSAVDLDGNYTADVIYAGDLFGNVWKIDVSNTVKTGRWKFSNKGTTGFPQPIFIACSSKKCDSDTVGSSNIQAITTQIQAVKQPQGVMLLFGTGKYLEAADNLSTGQTTQSFYGILDKSGIGPETIDKSKLLQQKITDEVSVDGNEYRVTSNNKVKDTDKASNQGWYIDLVSPSTGKNRGEKQISNALIKNGNVIFSTLLPNEDSCGTGISSWIMELDLRDGSRSKSSPYDVNGDGKFDAGDLIDTGDGKSVGSGIKSETGSIGSPSILTSKDGNDYLYINDTQGNIKKINQQSDVTNGRQSWRELDHLYTK